MASISRPAHAGIAACGNIHVEAEAECEVKGGIACEAECTPVTVRAQCAADLAVECRGGCDEDFGLECYGSCEASCASACEVDPGRFDCQGSCFADCEGRAQARCESESSECLASVEGACEAECEASCTATPPSGSCQGECQGSCEGSCRAEANIDCQIQCQGPSLGDCEVEAVGGCRAECQREDGALFCDGRYVDHGGHLEECVESLRALLNVEVEGYAECSGNRCEAGGSISCSCTSDDRPTRNAAVLTIGLLALLGLGRRRAFLRAV